MTLQSEIPEKWRAAALSKVELPAEDQVRSFTFMPSESPLSSPQRIALPGCYYRDSDYCFLDDLTGVSCSLPLRLS